MKIDFPLPTAKEIQEFREKTGASIIDAKRKFLAEREQKILEYLKQNGTLEEKVNYILEEMIKKNQIEVDKLTLK